MRLTTTKTYDHLNRLKSIASAPSASSALSYGYSYNDANQPFAAPEEVVVAERGPHHRVIERTLAERQPDGSARERKSSYTELATGLHYQNERGEWLESKEEIEIFQGAAVARQGQHQVIFAANLNSPGAIDMLSPDGKRFRSHVLGLAYTDHASGQSVMIASLKDCTGAVAPPNQVIYQDAFEGVLADVRYTYTMAGFEQDIILLTPPPPPEEYAMSSDSVRIEVWTEFIAIPEGTATPVVLQRENDPAARQQRAEPDLIDQRLDFGVMKMEQGQAFPLGETDPFSGDTVPTGKSLERIDGRVFLIEKVDYRDVRAHLEQLPQRAAAGVKVGPPSPQPRRLLSYAEASPAAPGEGARSWPRVKENSWPRPTTPQARPHRWIQPGGDCAPPLLGERAGVRAGLVLFH